MITPGYVRTMAAYNHWQNENLYGAADRLSDAERRADRGAFFGSIHATLNHVLWADRAWMRRLAGWPSPRVSSIAESVNECETWDELVDARVHLDRRLVAWAEEVTPADLDGDLTWFSGAASREFTKPRGLLFMQVFNHQTHHRGQVHAMLTAAGVRPTDTDLPVMPEVLRG